MMKIKHLMLYLALVALAAGLLWAGLALHTLWPDWRWENEPVHSSVEALGTVVAIFMTLVLFQRKQKEGDEKFFSLSIGFLSMGLLDGFHAFSSPGHGFVFLHSVAGLAGGFCFALVWLPGWGRYVSGRAHIPWAAAVASTLCGAWALLWPGTLPPMVYNGEFTTTAVNINFFAGVLFLVATARFVLDFQRSGELEAWLFACLTLLFGLAGLTFRHSLVWDSGWWLWHLLRLTAYLLVLGFVVRQYLVMVSVLQVALAEQRRTEKELRKHRDHLEELVTERTAELNARVAEVERLNRAMTNLLQDLQAANRNLEQTARELQKANKELADFAYIVSHDLKAPLRAISQLAGWVSTDYADVLDADGQEMLTLLTGRTQRMHNLIEGILQYSRIGRVREKERNVDLKQLVQEIIETLAPPEQVQPSVRDTLPTVAGEPTRLTQVFQNLLDNALKFMDKPQGRVGVGCVEQESHWLFSVSDDGPGIEEKHHARIFQMFQTLTPRDETESTGIGLALVKKIVETWGGKIWVESTVGQGSTFFFTLPKEGEK